MESNIYKPGSFEDKESKEVTNLFVEMIMEMFITDVDTDGTIGEII